MSPTTLSPPKGGASSWRDTAYASGTFLIRPPDTLPPTITGANANPATQIPGGSVSISASIRDDTAVASAFVDVTRPDGTHANVTMTAVGDAYAFTEAWTAPGTYTFTLWASDVSGNWAFATGSFAIRSGGTTPPTITHAAPAPVYADDPIRIDAFVTDEEGLQEVHLLYTPIGGAEQNVTMALSGGVYVYTMPGQSAAGVVRYRIYAVDATGIATLSEVYSVAVRERPSATAFDAGTLAVAMWILAAVAVLATIVAAAAFLSSRRKLPKEGEPQKP